MKYPGLILSALAVLATPVPADTIYDWARLGKVSRLAVVSPFFDEDAEYRKSIAAQNGATRGGRTASDASDQDDRAIRPADYLGRLARTMRSALPRAVGDSNRFRLISSAETDRALHALHWTARDLFLPRGTAAEVPRPKTEKPRGVAANAQDKMQYAEGKLPLHGKHKSDWLEPNTRRVAMLARRLHADAVLIGTMADPASVRQGIRLDHNDYSPNPINLRLRRVRDHVLSPRVQGFLVTPERRIVWTDDVIAEHPRTKPTTKRSLLVDYQEATVEVAQLVVDSLTRLPPPKK